nr:retrovirus-related Pol polyprotein from transposon TNT 1-94 [Tanacetum cinerariifolium]
MSSNSDDIQAAGSDAYPPVLDRTDYDSWSQRIRLYYGGKENGIYILQSIDHGPFELGTTRDTLGTTPEGGVLLGPERPRTYDDLNDNEKKRFDVDVRATNIVLQGLPKDIYKLINHNIEAKAIWDNSHQYPPSSAPLQSPHVQSLSYPHFDESLQLNSGYTKADETLDTLTKQVALLAQSFRATLPRTNNQLRTFFNTRNQATVQDGRVMFQNVQGRHNQNQRNFTRGNGARGNGGAHVRAGNVNTVTPLKSGDNKMVTIGVRRHRTTNK